MPNLIQTVKSKIYSITQKPLFKDSFWMTSFNILSSAVGLIYFVLLARYLGPESYGAFVGVKAIWAIVFPFIGLGMGDILIQQVSRNSDQFSHYWGSALTTLAMSVTVALFTIFPIVVFILPEMPALFILFIFLGDFIGLSLCQLSKTAFIANHQVKRASQSSILYTIGKLATVILLPLFAPESRLVMWGLLYLVGSIVPALILLLIINNSLGSPHFNLRNFEFEKLKEGFFFSLSASAVTINSEVDRSMLVALDSPLSAGIYGAGYRFIDIGFMPIMSVLGASYARFFKHGQDGISGTLAFARKLLPAALIYGVAFALFLFMFAPFVPRILGDEYAEAKSVLFWLSPVILLGGIQFLAADSLTGAGFQRSRSFIQVSAAALNVALNLVLIPIYSWKGAIIATLSSETFKAIILWLVVMVLYRREKAQSL